MKIIVIMLIGLIILSGCLELNNYSICDSSKGEIETEYGIVKDFRMLPNNGYGYSCEIVYDNGIKKFERGAMCNVLETGKLLVKYDFDYCKGQYPYGSIAVNKEND